MRQTHTARPAPIRGAAQRSRRAPAIASFAACALAGLLAACASAPRATVPVAATPPAGSVAPASAALPVTDEATLAALDAILGSAHRSDANRARDIYRHPHETLEFFGIRQDQTVMEIWPGAAGWYTEILAPLLREHGRYIAANWDPGSDLKLVQDSVAAFRTKLDAEPALYGRVTVTALQYPGAMSPVASGSVDLVVTFRNLHNWLAREGEAAAMLKAMFVALKPGGVLGIVDHRADPAAPLDPKARTGYVNEAYAVALIRAAGFEFVAATDVNRNPRDGHDYEQGVWTLPPTWRLGDKDRERYAAIGESDRFTLKFVKPR